MTRLLVLDASAALEAVMARPKATQVLNLVEAATRVTGPDLYVAEVANSLWKHVRAGDLEPDEAQLNLETCLDLVDVLLPATELAAEALATAAAHVHPVYDAMYAVAARRVGATVCTLDRRLVELLRAMAVQVAEL